MPLARHGGRSAVRGLSRRRAGRARIRLAGAVGEAGARRLPGRARLDHHPEEARGLPRRLRRLRSRDRRPLRRRRPRPADGRSGHRALQRQDRRRHRGRADLSPDARPRQGLLRIPLELRRRRADPEPLGRSGAGPDPDARGGRNVEGAQGERLQVRGPGDRLCVHAGDRHGERPHDRLLPPRARPTYERLMVKRPKPAICGPDMLLEKACPGMVCGVDEAGRGPWAGPVSAGAVILNPRRVPKGLDDSKKLSAKTRETLEIEIKAKAVAWGIGFASVEEIAELNILHATGLAMRRAVEALAVTPQFALVDG